jgi:hypothetical protein
VSIAGLILVFTLYSIMEFINSAHDVNEKTAALYLAEDGLELVRFMRDNDWDTIDGFALNTTAYLEVTSTGAVPTTTPEVLDSFTRSFVIENVYRNTSSDDIVASTTSGSAPDTDSKYVTMSVSWGTPIKNVSLTTILTNINKP